MFVKICETRIIFVSFTYSLFPTYLKMLTFNKFDSKPLFETLGLLCLYGNDAFLATISYTCDVLNRHPRANCMSILRWVRVGPVRQSKNSSLLLENWSKKRDHKCPYLSPHLSRITLIAFFSVSRLTCLCMLLLFKRQTVEICLLQYLNAKQDRHKSWFSFFCLCCLVIKIANFFVSDISMIIA